jgi:hypothetical protein
MGPLTKEIPEIDFRSIRDILRLRWWIFPLCVIVCIGLLYTQESNLQSTPSSVLVVATYGPRNETAGLSLYGIDPTAVREYPSFQNQLESVREQAAKDVEVQLGQPIDVSVSRPEQQVSLIAAEDTTGEQKLTMLSVGEPNYVLTCSASTQETCDQAIEIYVKQLSVSRADGIANGLRKLADDIQGVLDSSKVDQSQLQLQRNALLTASSSATGEMQLVSEIVEAQSGTITTVKKTTYVFGALAGLLIAALIILQLTYTDDKIRSSRKLLSSASAPVFLGEITSRNTTAEVRQVLAGLVTQSRVANRSVVSLLPVDTHVDLDHLIELMGEDAKSNGLTITKTPSVDEMSVAQMLDTASALTVIIARKNLSSLAAVRHAKEVLARSNNNVVGVVLVTLNR